MPRAHHSDVYLTALGAVLTLVYMTGLVFRPRRRHLRLGADSIVAVCIDAVGIAGLTLISG